MELYAPRLARVLGTTCGVMGQVMERFTKTNIRRAKPPLHLDPLDPNPIIAVEVPQCAEPEEARAIPPPEEELSLEEMRQWLGERDLLEGVIGPERIKRRYQAFSKCQFGEDCPERIRHQFMRDLKDWDHRMAVT